jgi:hypothetical protein
VKKIFLALFAVWFFTSAASAQGYGYAYFSGPPRGVSDPFSWSDPFHMVPSLRVAFLWGTGTPWVDNIATSIPTNAVLPYVDVNTAWNEILNDPNFHLAVDANTSAVVVTTNLQNGAWFYSHGGFSTFPVDGTSPGTNIVFVIAWPKVYATPADAALAGSPLGWSAPFFYQFVDMIGAPLSFAASGFEPFSIAGIPEPGTISLLALGAAAVCAMRRRR